MSTIDAALKANLEYGEKFQLGQLPLPPARRLAVVACMDARMTVEELLGIKTGDAHIIRNAGGIVTEDALRSLIISHHLLQTREVMIINHTDCGMLTFTDDELKQRLRSSLGDSPDGPRSFLSFGDLDQNVREQISRVRNHPWLPREISVRGFVYDVRSGLLKEVRAE
jgi:carbonic anhydrase